jgi:hypothetical protein
MVGWIGNGIPAQAPIRPNRAWKALGVIGPSRSVMNTCDDTPLLARRPGGPPTRPNSPGSPLPRFGRAFFAGRRGPRAAQESGACCPFVLHCRRGFSSVHPHIGCGPVVTHHVLRQTTTTTWNKPAPSMLWVLQTPGVCKHHPCCLARLPLPQVRPGLFLPPGAVEGGKSGAKMGWLASHALPKCDAGVAFAN